MLFSVTSRVLNRVTLNRTTMAVDKVTRDEQVGFRKDISCLTRKLSEKRLALKQSGHLSEAVYNKIRPQTQTAT